MKKQKRVITFSAAPISDALVSAGKSARQLMEKRIGPRPFAVMGGAVNYLRRTIAPAAGKFHEWCEAAPVPGPKTAKRRMTQEDAPIPE